MAVEIGTAHLDLIPRFNPDVARVQVLELPSVQGIDGRHEVPFVLVVDGITPEDAEALELEDLKRAVGAKAIWVSKARINV